MPKRMILVLAAALAVPLVGTVDGGAGTARADSQQVTNLQMLYYNHAYAVVDTATADAIENSDFLREFANFEVRTTTGGSFSWKGRYLYGRETYLEFFGEGDLPGQDAEFGSTGLALSTENTGNLATVVERLRDHGVNNPVEYLQTRDFGDGVRVPWFDTIRTFADQYEAFDPWAMEYRQEYFADPRGNTEPASYSNDVSRERYLSDAYADHLMRDITAIHMGVPERDFLNTLPLLRAGGFTVRTSPGGAVATGGGTTIRLDVVPRAEAGLKRVDFSLNRSVARHEERIGRSTLVLGPDARAVWTFEPRP
jgi:hypothetical protein